MPREKARQAFVRPTAEPREGEVGREFPFRFMGRFHPHWGGVEDVVNLALQAQQWYGGIESQPEYSRFSGTWRKDADTVPRQVECWRLDQRETLAYEGEIFFRSATHEA